MFNYRLRPLPLVLLAASFVLVPLACRPVEAQDVSAMVDEWAADTDFNGVVLVGLGDSTLFAQAFGYADFEDQLPTTVDARYQLGSIGKWVSSLVVLRLVDEGKLDLHAPIATYLPDMGADIGNRVTLHHLLSHASGVPNDIIAAIVADASILTTPLATDEAVRRYASGDLLFEPGARFDYSHSNWILVKAIVEQATGQSFVEVAQSRIFDSLGLTGMGIAEEEFSRYGVVFGYESTAPPERSPAVFPDYLAAAGGAYGTAPDLLKLVDAVASGDVLSDASLSALNTVYDEDEGYAYGGRVRQMKLGGQSETVLWHTGSNGPSKSRLSRALESGFTVVTLSNAGAEHDETDELHERILASLASRE